MASIQKFIHRGIAALRSPQGRNAAGFLVFVAISAILWCVLSLNEEEQRDIRMQLRITHVPDSVTLISKGPDALSVSLRARGTQLMKMTLGGTPVVTADFRAYSSQGTFHLAAADLKALVRNAAGGAQVSLVYPDTLSIPFTTQAGYEMPVKADCKVTPNPQSALVGKPKLSTDSVKVFIAPGYRLPDHYDAVTTEPLRLIGIGHTTTQRVKLIGPPHSRVIPDSVDITFEVEPMIFKSRKVVIEPVNVPANTKLITFPAQIDVFFMVPMSSYTNGNIRFRVVADYRTISQHSGSKMVKLSLRDVPQKLQNVQLSADSAEYIIERH